MDVSQPEANSPLNYAPAEERRQRRLFRRFAIPVLIAFTLLAAIFWGPDILRQVFYLRGQSRCMTFNFPAGQVVYTNAPDEAATLQAGGYKPVASVLMQAFVQTPGVTMSAGAEMPPLADVGEDRIALYGNGFYRQSVPGAPMRTGAFLHARSTPSGKQRLVSVVFLEKQSSPQEPRHLEINALVWRPALWQPGARLQLVGLSTLVLSDLDRRRVHVFAGQPDPADATRFTLGYDVDGAPGVIDGALDDFDQAQLQVRTGPATSTAYTPARR